MYKQEVAYHDVKQAATEYGGKPQPESSNILDLVISLESRIENAYSYAYGLDRITRAICNEPQENPSPTGAQPDKVRSIQERLERISEALYNLNYMAECSNIILARQFGV